MEKKVVATNRKAFHDYTILETIEAGIVLAGHEVKSLRGGKSSLTDGMVTFLDTQAVLENVYIPPYTHQSTHVMDYNPRHKRKLLMHATEIHRLSARVKEKGLTVIPLELYFSPRNIAKVAIGLAKGKRSVDKRDVIRKRDLDRQMERDIS